MAKRAFRPEIFNHKRKLRFRYGTGVFTGLVSKILPVRLLSRFRNRAPLPAASVPLRSLKSADGTELVLPPASSPAVRTEVPAARDPPSRKECLPVHPRGGTPAGLFARRSRGNERETGRWKEKERDPFHRVLCSFVPDEQSPPHGSDVTADSAMEISRARENPEPVWDAGGDGADGDDAACARFVFAVVPRSACFYIHTRARTIGRCGEGECGEAGTRIKGE